MERNPTKFDYRIRCLQWRQHRKNFLTGAVASWSDGICTKNSNSEELHIHRVTIAQLRKNVGGDFYLLHKEMVDHFLDDTDAIKSNYWKKIGDSFTWIIVVSTVLSFASVLLILY